jgi:hypothetical protein
MTLAPSLQVRGAYLGPPVYLLLLYLAPLDAREAVTITLTITLPLPLPLPLPLTLTLTLTLSRWPSGPSRCSAAARVRSRTCARSSPPRGPSRGPLTRPACSRHTRTPLAS